MSKNNEIKLTITGANDGNVDKLRPTFALTVGGEMAVAIIAKKEAAYTVTPSGKRFAVKVPSGDCLKVILAARNIANWCGAEMGGALKVITDSENWRRELPVYLEAEADKKGKAALLSAARAAIKYWGTVERDPNGDGYVFPNGTPTVLCERFINCEKAARSANEYFTDCQKTLDRVVWSFMRPCVERYFTAVKGE